MKPTTPRIAIAAVTALAAATTLSASASASSSSGSLPQHRDVPASSTLAQHRGGGSRDATVTIYLTRHGQTILNTLERVQGWTDSPLMVGTNPDGSKLDARTLPFTVGKNLRAREGKFDAAYAADMKRHNETASYLLKGARQNLTINQDARLRELNFGRYEGVENKEMWTAMVENLGYKVNHDLPATAPVDSSGQNGGWQTMQALAIKERGIKAMMASMKELAEQPSETGVVFPAEDCTDVSKRTMASLNSIAKDAVKHHDTKVLVVSSGLTITCTLDSLGTTVSGGISNVAVSKLEYRKGQWTVKTVGDISYRD